MKTDDLTAQTPDREISVRDTFGIDVDMVVTGFTDHDDHVPEVDAAYRFNPDATLAILVGFQRNKECSCKAFTAPVNPRILSKSPPD